MLQTTSSPKSGEGFWLWFYKMVSGPLIIVILVIHFIVNHLAPAEGGLMTWEMVVAYYQNPIIPIMEGLFLILVVSHSLIGLRSIVLDLKPSRSVLKVVDWGFGLLGAGFIVYGLWLLYAVMSFG
jgi:succinate dehydrogenase / fumarate reductase membrane anchor subunit